MKQPTAEQLVFLKNHGISFDLVFNAQGMSKEEYRRKMKVTGKIVAFNVTPCKENGHSLRSRSGHCIQCHPARFAFQKRNELEGVVYIATTNIGQIIKVGFSKAVAIRNESLNRTRYGGFEDWEIIFAIKSNSAGKIENKINSKLKKYCRNYDYDHDGHFQKTTEIFTCSVSKAKHAILNLCNEGKIEVVVLLNIDTDDSVES